MSNTPKETPEERRARLLRQLENARKRKEQYKKEEAEGKIAPRPEPLTTRKPTIKQLSRIVQEVLADPSWVDKVIKNQPGWWEGLPEKNAGYIMTTAIATMAMSGNLKAAEWIRKTGFGDKVTIEAEDDSFFGASDFTIQVMPSKHKEALDDASNLTKLLDKNIPSEPVEGEVIDPDEEPKP